MSYLRSNLEIRGLLLTHVAKKGNAIHRYDWNRGVLSGISIQARETPLTLPAISLTSEFEDADPTDARPILVHIGGGWKYKRWDVKKWETLIPELNNVQPTEVICGPAESDELKSIQKKIQNIPCSVTPHYRDLVRKISGCELLVCLDSGPMNLAVLLGKKVVALFGPGDSTMWYPYANGMFIHMKESFPCNPCAQRICFFPDASCMDQIEPWKILAMVKKMTYAGS